MIKDSSQNISETQLVSSIRNTVWIDLSPSHKELRTFLEESVENACVKHRDTSPIMVKGAFGIGKTATLHYLFHHSWTKLNIPCFILNLGQLNKEIASYLKDSDLQELPNKDVCKIIGKILDKQANLLKKQSFDDINGGEIYFPAFDKHKLSDYLGQFEPAELHTNNNGDYSDTCLPILDQETIQTAIGSGNRFLFLIDEFEAKYHELKKLIEPSGGGMLRDYFDDIANVSSSNHFCIIGNGPASGYELSSSSGAAEARRLIVKQIHSPTVDTLSISFLKGYARGHINFYWWLSRSRPGQIKKIKQSLQLYPDLMANNYIGFIRDNQFLKDPIDEVGESNVTFIKTDLFQPMDVELKNVIKDLLITMNPQKKPLAEEVWKERFLNFRELFYSSNELTKYEHLLSVLQKDIIKIKDDDKKYNAINFDDLHRYLDLILMSISNDENEIAFGVVNKKGLEEMLSKTFLVPIFGLLYDFISIYEDDTEPSIKLSLDFVLDLINKAEAGDVEMLFPTTINLCEDNSVRISTSEEVYVQLSLFALRETIEQPVGSPKLSYQSSSLDKEIEIVSEVKNVFIHKSRDNEIIIIPDITTTALLNTYIDEVQEYIQDNWDEGEKYGNDGRRITQIIYFRECDKIEEFKSWLFYKNGDQEEIPYKLKRIDVRNYYRYSIHNSQQVSDFMNSVCFISMVASTKGETAFNGHEDKALEINRVIKNILHPDWTKSKKTQRTIEYFRDLLTVGDNCSFNHILKHGQNEYDKQIAEYITDRNRVKHFSNNAKLRDVDHFDLLSKTSISTKNFIAFLLTQHEESDYDSILTLLREMRKLNFSPNEEEKNLSLPQVGNFVNNKFQDEISGFYEEFSNENREIVGITRYLDLFVEDHGDCTVEQFISLLDPEYFDCQSYFDYLGISYNKQYFIKGLYLKQLSSSISSSEYIDTLKEILLGKQQAINDLSDELHLKYEVLNSLYGVKDEKIWPKDIDLYITKLISPYLSLLNQDSSIPFQVVGAYINSTIDNFIDRMQKYFTRLETLEQHLIPIQSKIHSKQEIIDNIYRNGESMYIGKLFKEKYSSDRNSNYLYDRVFLPSIKQIGGGDTYNNIFKKLYKATGSLYIEDQNIIEMKNIIDQSFESKAEEFNDIVDELTAINNSVAETINLENIIRELLRLDEESNNVEFIESSVDIKQELDYDNINKKYEVAKDIVGESPDDIRNRVEEYSGVVEIWEQTKALRVKIDSGEKYKKYQAALVSCFNDIYEYITAPGVQVIISWLHENDTNELISKSKRTWIKEFLIEEYNDHKDEITSILQNLQSIEPDASIFTKIKKNIRINVIKLLSQLDGEKVEFQRELPEYISGFYSLLNDVSDIEALKFTDHNQFISSIVETDDGDNSVEIDGEAEHHLDLIKKIIDQNDDLSTDKTLVSLENIPKLVLNNITDIYTCIDLLKQMEVSPQNPPEIASLYSKFEKSLELKAGMVSRSLDHAIENTWNPMMENYQRIDEFKKQNLLETVEQFQAKQAKWSGTTISHLLEQYIATMKTALLDNSLNKIATSDISEIAVMVQRQAKKITDINEDVIREEIQSFASQIVDDYDNTRIVMLKRLDTETGDIDILEKSLQAVSMHSENIFKSDNLLETVSEEFIYMIDRIKACTAQYQEILAKSPIKKVLPFLDTLAQNEQKIDDQYLTSNIEEINALLKLDFINITIKRVI
jgi:hypothetical protein